MPPRARVDHATVRVAFDRIAEWLYDVTAAEPVRADIAAAVRGSARLLALDAPGASVEVRVPPFVAVQCIAGPRHTRGTPPNVVETDPRTWLLLAAGLVAFDAVVESGAVTASGNRAVEVADWLPLVRLG